MRSSEQFLQELSAVARSLQNETGARWTLELAVVAATSFIEGCDLAGISIAGPSGVHTRAASDEGMLVTEGNIRACGWGATCFAG